MKKKRKMNSDPCTVEWSSPYLPCSALQCHSNNVKNDKVQIWNVAFEVSHDLDIVADCMIISSFEYVVFKLGHIRMSMYTEGSLQNILCC